jgi:hypothetical protein
VEIERRCCATRHDGGRGEAGERERTSGEERRREKETRYILYDSVIAFPRTNIAPAERTQENVDVNRRPLLLSAFLSLSLGHPIPPPRNLSFFTASVLLWEKTFVKRFLRLSSRSPVPRASTLFDSPNPANLRHLSRR